MLGSILAISKKTSLQSLVKSSSNKYTTQSVGKLVRSSNPGLRAVVFGAYGQVGRYVVSLLAGSGVQCVIPYRGDEYVS
jgi:hypothetical protein